MKVLRKANSEGGKLHHTVMLSKKRILKKGRRSFSSAFFYLILGALVLGLLVFLFDANLKLNRKRNQLQSQINQLEEQLKAQKEKKAQYEQGLSRAQTQEFLEEKIREQGYQKPGEEVFVVVPPEETEEKKIEEEKNWWQKIIDFVSLTP